MTDGCSCRLAAKLQAKYGANSAEDFMAGRRWYAVHSHLVKEPSSPLLTSAPAQDSKPFVVT